ncbi:hypothetical protein BC941DRAFT_473707 [Chlamydoabsidia padenii]|nr:hypothetical protein BC941DRAFT_473707 [Chlamydoabsidia padenii]
MEQYQPWLLMNGLVAKPDQFIKRRGKSGSLTLKNALIEKTTFLVEFFTPHPSNTEYYIIRLYTVHVDSYFTLWWSLLSSKVKLLESCIWIWPLNSKLERNGPYLAFHPTLASSLFKQHIDQGPPASLVLSSRNWMLKQVLPASMAYVSKSNGMSNKFNDIVSRTMDGGYKDPNYKVLVLIGEVSGEIQGERDCPGFTVQEFATFMQKIKSHTNPNMRMELVKPHVKKNFLQAFLLEHTLKVEGITISKNDNLILDVDGCIFDLLFESNAFNLEEAEE